MKDVLDLSVSISVLYLKKIKSFQLNSIAQIRGLRLKAIENGGQLKLTCRLILQAALLNRVGGVHTCKLYNFFFYHTVWKKCLSLKG